MRNILRVSLRGGWMALCLLVILSVGAFAQGGGNGLAAVPGQILVYAKPGAATQDDVRRMAVAANATLVRPLLM